MGRQERLKRERRAERGRRAGGRAHVRRTPAVLLAGVVALVLAAALGAFLLGRSAATGGPGGQGSGQGAPAVGQRFPDFSLTEVDGRRLSVSALAGKPALVWFTTSYCVPCQVGARVVARLDDELGGDAFNVLVVFVDPEESPSALEGWRERYANPDWLVALDEDLALATAVELRVLDTKFLLDGRGTVRDVDYAVADEDYARLLRKEVGAS
ncbi:MAG TPA: TlpA disulfide reductase family protein [Gaiellaceae bacterium]|jgi:cytochrome oxidase Cu insertion factor (SCO1/SenC/PrrC family)|nr:TlpA disulfide reductase family protein [Gaiellaceae bacterium]